MIGGKAFYSSAFHSQRQDAEVLVTRIQTDLAIVSQARKLYENDDVQIEPVPAIDRVDDGAWVRAWVFVPKKESSHDSSD